MVRAAVRNILRSWHFYALDMAGREDNPASQSQGVAVVLWDQRESLERSAKLKISAGTMFASEKRRSIKSISAR